MHNEEIFDDDEMRKENVVVEKEKRFVHVNNDDDEAEGTIKQAHKMKRIRKRKSYEKKKMTPPWLGESYTTVHRRMTLVLYCSPPPLLLGEEFWFTTLKAMKMLRVSPLIAQA